MTIQTIDHLNIVVRDLDRVADFFVALGFEVEARAALSGDWISRIVGLEGVSAEYVKLHLPDNQTRLELIRYDTPPTPAQSFQPANHAGFRHLAFAVDNIDATIAHLQSLDVTFLSEATKYAKTGKRLVYFVGPEDILLELAEYPHGETK